MIRFLLMAAMFTVCAPAAARPPAPSPSPTPSYPDDPLHSPMWAAHARTIFGSDAVQFDPRVRLSFPTIAENQRNFPVTLDARGIEGVRRMVIFADLNPIPIAIDYRPSAAEAYVATRIKLDQRTPVRGAVQLADGRWLVSGGWIDAAGGGCSAPPVSRVRGDWAEHLGEIRGQAWTAPGSGVSRVRMVVRHPMDTGLVAGIPAYNIERVSIASASGRSLGEIDVSAAVGEDPAITVMPRAMPGETLALVARDSNGRDFAARVTVPTGQP